MGEVNPGTSLQGQGQEKEDLIPNVKQVLAISSGKGGVGKSTVAVNLAVALSVSGAKVGLMDADVYGPNIPMMMGVTNPPEQQDGKIKPAESHGVKLISMGFFVPEETAVVWRGPMIHTAIQQFFRDVVWGDLDYLLIDLPPGTGDAQLTISQLVPLCGAVTVTTPQEVALHDVRKGRDDVPESQCSLAGDHREHELLCLRALRYEKRHLFQRWGRAGGGKTRDSISGTNPNRSRDSGRRRHRNADCRGRPGLSSGCSLSGDRSQTG